MIKKNVAAILTIMMMLGLTGCGSKTGGTETTVKCFIPSEEADIVLTTYQKEKIYDFEESDYFEDYSKEKVTTVSFSGQTAEVVGDGAGVSAGVLTITEGGRYVLSGSFDGRIVIEAGEDEKVYLYLNNVDVTSSDGPAIYEKSADRTIISLLEKTDNRFSDSEAYSDVFSEITACVYFKDTVTINGTGTLNITANKNDGVASEGTVKVMNGNCIISAVDDGIVACDSFVMNDGCLNISTGGHGIKTANEEKGKIYILGGIVNAKADKDGINSATDLEIYAGIVSVSTKNDGLHADNILFIDDGVVTVYESTEGIEGRTIVFNGGDITVNSEDDGINATNGNENNTTPSVTINGGKVKVYASGAGIDSTGDIYINGGFTMVDGPTGNMNATIGYDGAFIMNKGVLIAIGSSGMYQSISKDSELSVINYFPANPISAGSSIVIKDGDNELIEFTTVKSSKSLLFCSEKLECGKTYTICINDTPVRVTAETGGLYNGFAGNGFGNIGGPGGGELFGEKTGKFK